MLYGNFIQLFDGLDDVISDTFAERIWTMIYERYKVYEEFRNIR